MAAWQGLGGFEERASIRTWLYRIATNRCLNARRSASRRPAKEWDIAEYQPPEPTRLGEIVWLEPFPDALLEGVMDVPLGPEARYEQAETISLAFVTALQVLPPRQLAVLVLRDVLGFHANEVAEMLDSTIDSVNSLLKRARAGLQRRLSTDADREPAPAPDSPSEQATVAEFVRAYESGDLDALGRPAHGRRLPLDAAVPARVRGHRRRHSLLREHDRLRSEVRPRADPSQRSAGVRGLSACPYRGPPRDRPLGPHPRRRPDQLRHPLRHQRASLVRAAAIAPEPVAGRGWVSWARVGWAGDVRADTLPSWISSGGRS